MVKLIVYLCALAHLIAGCDQINSNEEQKKFVQVKIVSLEKCESTSPTIELLKETANEMGIVIDFTHVVVRNSEEAIEHRHIGSPTVQINGVDIDPAAKDIKQFGVT